MLLAVTFALGLLYPNLTFSELLTIIAAEHEDLIVTVHSTGSISTNIIAYDGKGIGGQGYIEFEGVTYPAFCVDTLLYGAHVHPNGQYPVNISGTNLDPKVSAVLHNSYPYLSTDTINLQFPGLDDMQIYAATKAAIRAVSDESSAEYSNDSLWTGHAQTVAFAKHLINIGRNATAPVEAAIYGYADPTEAVAEGDYYVKAVTVQSSNYPLQAVTKIRLALTPNAPVGTIITDISDNPIPASGVDNFTRIKIKVPKAAVTAGSTVNFEVRADLSIESKVILFGLPSDAADQGAYQRYEISIGGCALGSRKAALEFKRRLFISDRRGHQEGDAVSCNALSVGPNRLLVECNGFDFELRQKDISYTPMADMRKEYKVGQEFKAKIKKYNSVNGITRISTKEMYPHPFDGAEARHPIDSKRQAIISGTYAGGLFCRLSDDTNVMCSYMPGRFNEEFYIGDTVILRIGRYDNIKKQIYGKIVGKQ